MMPFTTESCIQAYQNNQERLKTLLGHDMHGPKLERNLGKWARDGM